jgi:predicted nucleic acid-binding protein
MIILDTNVLSELMAPSPASNVEHWLGVQPATSLYTTCITQAEILFGIRLLPKGKRRDRIETAADSLFDRVFAGRLLPFGSDAARSYARIAAERRRRGKVISALDAQIAAIARAAGASLATRNVFDFEGCGIEVVDPWAPASER